MSELGPGDVVQVQNQVGPHARKWDLSGVVVESLGFDSYNVRMDGSGRLTKRNRRFLRPIKAYKDVLSRGVEPQRDVQTIGDTVKPREVDCGMSDTAGYSSLLPEARASKPDDTVTCVPGEGVLEFPVQMTDKDFDEGLLRAAASVQQREEVNDGNVVPVEAGRRLRRSSRNVVRPASYGR